jgi:hypothetical protein
MRARRRPAGLWLLVVALVAGCSSHVSGSASPTILSTSSPSRAAPGSAPRVAHPLDAGRFTSDPCSSLTVPDLAGVQIVNATTTPTHQQGGVLCQWQASGAGNAVGIGWVLPITDGLSGFYLRRSTWEYFQPTTVSGYPAVYGAVDDTRTSGSCELNVGVNDHLYFLVSYDLAVMNDSAAYATTSCAAAATVARDVIRNLSGGS